jgi:hypothetical protein
MKLPNIKKIILFNYCNKNRKLYGSLTFPLLLLELLSIEEHILYTCARKQLSSAATNVKINAGVEKMNNIKYR